jgi:cytochrome c biogenesis protein CcmG/thiol:disulfide interchange protein DsbE
LQKKYRSKDFAVVGVSLDDDGWNVLRPFLAEHKPGYTMLLGDKPIGQRYGIEMLPDTFLIDRQGRIAAAYVGLVDRENLDTNVRSLLAQH